MHAWSNGSFRKQGVRDAADAVNGLARDKRSSERRCGPSMAVAPPPFCNGLLGHDVYTYIHVHLCKRSLEMLHFVDSGEIMYEVLFPRRFLLHTSRPFQRAARESTIARAYLQILQTTTSTHINAPSKKFFDIFPFVRSMNYFSSTMLAQPLPSVLFLWAHEIILSKLCIHYLHMNMW